MITKLKLFWNLLKEGQCVLDPVKWKSRQVSANQIAILLSTLVAIAAAFGYPIPVDDNTVLAIAGGIFALVNWVFTLITTDKIGISMSPKSQSSHKAESEKSSDTDLPEQSV